MATMDMIADLLKEWPEGKEAVQNNAHVWQDVLVSIANRSFPVDAATTRAQQTMLHYACYFNKVDVVRQLLLFNANPEAKDIYGYTPMDYTWYKCHKMKELLQEGIAARKRWTPPRAAWCAACVVCL
jgi:hypothetical protein